MRPAPVECILEAAALLACGESPQYGYELSAWLVGEDLVAGVVSPGRLYETLGTLVSIGALIVDREPGDKGPGRPRKTLGFLKPVEKLSELVALTA